MRRMWTPLTTAGREERTLELLLRIGVFGCFVGHGAFGVIGKEAWLPYFAVARIPESWAWTLMPIVGSIDIAVGIVALLSPRPVALFYAAFWAVWTALLRPLAGESVFETLERAGNYGVPIALLVLAGVSFRPDATWLRPIRIGRLEPARRERVMSVLRVTTATLLVGHGGLALAGKPLLAGHLAVLGLGAEALPALGIVELGLAAAVALRLHPSVLLAVLGWKLGTEALFPVSGAPLWEFVERAGSYIAPLALWTLERSREPATVGRRAEVVGGALGALLISALLGSTVSGLDSEPGPAASGTVQEAPLLATLRNGGLVLACRHAITDRSRGDARRVDFGDPSTQRVLSAAGEAQARRLGRALAALDLPIGEVLASPYQRTHRSAELSFGRARVEEALFGGGDAKRRRLGALVREVPADGTLRVLMTHQGTLYRALPEVPRGSIEEGDCLVVAPRGADREPRVLRRLGPADWERLGEEGNGVEPAVPSAPAAVRAARAGGTTLVCRHAATGSFREREPVDYADSTTQRLLSRAGERQSRRIGGALQAAGVRIEEVVASPMNRARRTAELMFDRAPRVDPIWHTNGGDYGGAPRAARRRVLAEPPSEGNRLIVSHIGTMRSVLDGLGRDVREGDCVVVRPEGEGYRVEGVVRPEEWARGG